MNKKVDIIIPLFNGYSFFKECVDSILKNTDPETYRLIVVNDCSTEEKVLDYLKEIKKNGAIVLNNKENLGFVKSCNRGMQYGEKNDVLLLNSDTVVTKNWLEKIKKCAYSRDNIGTVTPITNNGALVSFPNQWEDNKIPKGYTADSLAYLIEKVSLEIYPEIPSPVGFCMYIKREVIKKVGFFDEIYGKGYGEENDFGMRAYREGYRHVLDDTNFILHKGSLTFKNINEEKKELIQKNSKILHSRFPELDKLLKKFEEEKPLEPIFKNIIINIETDKLKKKGILFVSVDEPDEFSPGALQHVQSLIKNISDDFSKYLVYRKKNKIILVFYGKNRRKIRYIFNFHEPFNITKFTHSEIDFIWELILRNFNIDIIHFQTPQELPLSLFKLSKELGKTIFFTAHDFFLYCPSFILLRKNTESKNLVFCNYEKNEEICRTCLKDKTGINIIFKNFQTERRAFIKKEVLPYIDKIIFPSNFLRNAILNFFPNQIPREKIIVIPHGIKNSKSDYVPQPQQKEIVNIAYLGTFMKEKGSQIFTEIVLKARKNTQLKFFIIGAIGDEESISRIKNQRNLEIIGKYKNKDLPKIIKKNNIDLACILSLCPETFSLTLSEAWANNLPVITLDMGSQKERVSESGAGWIVKPENADVEISKIINQIINNKKIILEKLEKVPLVKNEKENALEFESLYKSVSSAEKKGHTLSTKRMFRYLETVEISEIKQLSKKGKFQEKVYSLDRSYIKHVAFVFFSKLGLADKIRPIYYKYRDRIDNVINCLFYSSH